MKHDLRSAMLLSGAFAIVAAASVPLLMDMLPPEAQELPLSLPLFCVLLAVLLFIVYGLLALGGLRLARRGGLSPAPLLTAFWSGRSRDGDLRRAMVGFAVGLAGGVFLVGAVAVIQRLAPDTLPGLLHPPSPLTALAASTAASFGEEILFRLFLLSLLLNILPRKRVGTGIAIVASAILFGAAHAPALVYLFGGLDEVPSIAWAWLIGLNGVVGVLFGAMFVRYGIGCAIVAHFGTDLVWHVASQLGS